MSKHTPGPWNVYQGQHDAAIETQGVTLAMVPDDATEWASNAHLIAAAPELLEALKLAYPRLHRALVSDEQREQIRAAIAKAEGGAP